MASFQCYFVRSSALTQQFLYWSVVLSGFGSQHCTTTCYQLLFASISNKLTITFALQHSYCFALFTNHTVVLASAVDCWLQALLSLKGLDAKVAYCFFCSAKVLCSHLFSSGSWCARIHWQGCVSYRLQVSHVVAMMSYLARAVLSHVMILCLFLTHQDHQQTLFLKYSANACFFLQLQCQSNLLHYSNIKSLSLAY